MAPLLDSKLECLCSADGERVCPRPPAKRRDWHTPSEGWIFPWRCFAGLKTLSLCFLTVSPSLFCFFDFSSSLLLGLPSIKETGIQNLIRYLFWGTSLTSSRSAHSPIQVSSLPQHLISWILWPVVWWAKRRCIVLYCSQLFIPLPPSQRTFQPLWF